MAAGEPRFGVLFEGLSDAAGATETAALLNDVRARH
jgi:hypothetical protein